MVLIPISVPARMAWQAVMELLNGAPPANVVARMREIVTKQVCELSVKDLFVRVIQPGRTRMVLAHLVLPVDFPFARNTPPCFWTCSSRPIAGVERPRLRASSPWILCRCEFRAGLMAVGTP